MILIIYAHPNTKGHNKRILSEIKENLKEKYEVIDLYKIKYDPILHEDEHYTTGNNIIKSQNKVIQNKIKKANKIIFIYPIWWGTMPAILKGFFDKVFTPGFAYKFKNKIPKKLLKNKKALILTTSGASNFMSIFFNQCAKKNIQKNILGFCGIKSQRYNIGNSTELTENQKKKIKEAVKKGLKWLNT